LKRFDRVVLPLARVLDAVAGGAVVLMMLTVVYNVLVRLANGLLPAGTTGLPALTGEQDIVGLLLSVAIGFALASCALAGSHIAIGILYERFSARTRFVLDLVIGVLSLVFFSLFAYRLFAEAVVKQAVGEVSMTAGIPVFPFLIVTGIGLVVLCLAIIHIHFHGWKKGPQA
jgi:TRAP-type mannitol/chloroaromatic compound transport system permease small subunit